MVGEVSRRAHKPRKADAETDFETFLSLITHKLSSWAKKFKSVFIIIAVIIIIITFVIVIFIAIVIIIIIIIIQIRLFYKTCFDVYRTITNREQLIIIIIIIIIIYKMAIVVVVVVTHLLLRSAESFTCHRARV